MDHADVIRALENDELEPCFQPVVELRTGRLAGFEVLARWQHPELGLILPENFITLAEQNGLIGNLSHQIVRKAFMSVQMLPEPLVLAINFSPIQLHYLSLPSQIRQLADETKFPLERLTVEITESALVNNLECAQKIAVELKTMGCKLALDDFGTGYSSLRHLQALPFDELKIDRSFIRSMTDKRESRKIVAAMVGLGCSLGMITLAEGVETEEQADMLLWLGCELGQGWLYGHPLPADQIPGIVAAAPRTLSNRMSLHGSERGISGLEALPSQRLAQLLAIYNGVPVGLCFLDRNLRYVSLNRRLADLNGAPVADHIGRTVEEMIPEMFPRVHPHLLRALQGEATEGVEVSKPSPTPGGPDLTVLLSFQPAFDEVQEVIGVSIAIMDITERKGTEEALRESEEHLQYMVEHNPEIPWVLDSEGNNLDVSSRWTKITGLSKERTRGMGWFEALHPEDVEPIMKALHTASPIDVEFRVKNIDRGWRWMRFRGSPRFGPSGQLVRWYGSVEDVDARKQ